MSNAQDIHHIAQAHKTLLGLALGRSLEWGIIGYEALEWLQVRGLIETTFDEHGFRYQITEKGYRAVLGEEHDQLT